MDPRGLVPPGTAHQQMLQQQAAHQQALHRQALLQHQQQQQNLYAQQSGYQQGGMSHVNGGAAGSQAKPGGLRASREGGFADLNAEPPASDGEADGPVPSDSTPSAATMPHQEGSRASPPEEKKKRKKGSKEGPVVKDGLEDLRKSAKPAKSRAKPKSEHLDTGLDGDTDSQVTGVPTTREEKLKSLKAGLVHVAKKLPKNAHAQFFLGLMFQRLGQPAKAATYFEKAAEILKQSEEESGQNRAQFLQLVQIHQAECLLHSNLMVQLGHSGKELKREELEGVISKVREGAQEDSGQASIWNTLGLLLFRTGRVQSAVAVFSALLSIVPDYLDALANLGVAHMQSGHLLNAMRCFQAVLEKERTHPGALVNYGALLIHQYGFSGTAARSGGYNGVYSLQHTAAVAAQQYLQSAVKDDPKAAHIWSNLAAAYAASGSIWDANKCLEQAAKLEPYRMSTRFAVAAHRLRDVERLDGSAEQAEQLNWAANEMASLLREGDSTVQPHLAWAGLAMVNRAQHETVASFEGGGLDLKEVEDRAIRSLHQAIDEDPNNAVPWHQLGLHTLCTLQFGDALKYFRAAIARRHNCPVSWSNLGIALQFSDDPSSAEAVYKQALALARPELVHTILSNLGNLYRQKKRFSEAHAVYRKALELCPDYAPAYNNLGLLHIAEGDWDLAIASFDRALAADPYFEAARSNKMKAEVLAQVGKSSLSTKPTSSQPPNAPVLPVPSPASDTQVLLSSDHPLNLASASGQGSEVVHSSEPPQHKAPHQSHDLQSSQSVPCIPTVQTSQLPFGPSVVNSLQVPQLASSNSMATLSVPSPVAARASSSRQSHQREPFPLPSIS